MRCLNPNPMHGSGSNAGQKKSPPRTQPSRQRIHHSRQTKMDNNNESSSPSNSSVNRNRPSANAYIEYYRKLTLSSQKSVQRSSGNSNVNLRPSNPPRRDRGSRQSDSAICYPLPLLSIRNTDVRSKINSHSITNTGSRGMKNSSRPVTSHTLSSSRGRTVSSNASVHSEGHPRSDVGRATMALQTVNTSRSESRSGSQPRSLGGTLPAATTAGPPVTVSRPASRGRSRSRTKSRSIVNDQPPDKQPIEEKVEGGEIMHDGSTQLLMTSRMNSIWNQVSDYIGELDCKDNQGHGENPLEECKDGSDGIRLAMAELPASSDEESDSDTEEEESRTTADSYRKTTKPKCQGGSRNSSSSSSSSSASLSCGHSRRHNHRRRNLSNERGTLILVDAMKAQHKKMTKKKTESGGKSKSSLAGRKSSYTIISSSNTAIKGFEVCSSETEPLSNAASLASPPSYNMDEAPYQTTARGGRSISVIAKRRSFPTTISTSSNGPVNEGGKCSSETDSFDKAGSLASPPSSNLDEVLYQTTMQGRISISATTKRRSFHTTTCTSRPFQEEKIRSSETDLFDKAGRIAGSSSSNLDEVPHPSTARGGRSTSDIAKRRSFHSTTGTINRPFQEEECCSSKTDSFDKVGRIAGPSSSNLAKVPHQSATQGRRSTSAIAKWRSFHTTASTSNRPFKEDRFCASETGLLGGISNLRDSSSSTLDGAPYQTTAQGRRSTSAITNRRSFHTTASSSDRPFKEEKSYASETDSISKAGRIAGSPSSHFDEAPYQATAQSRRSTSAIAKIRSFHSTTSTYSSRPPKGDRFCASVYPFSSYLDEAPNQTASRGGGRSTSAVAKGGASRTTTSTRNRSFKEDRFCASETNLLGRPNNLRDQVSSALDEASKQTTARARRSTSIIVKRAPKEGYVSSSETDLLVSSLANRKSHKPNWTISSAMRSFHSNGSRGANEGEVTGKEQHPVRAGRHRSPSLIRRRSPSLSRQPKQVLGAKDARASSQNSNSTNRKGGGTSEASMIYDVSFDRMTGRCYYHPTVCMAIRHEDKDEKGSRRHGGLAGVKVVGGWKVVRTSCPKCTLQSLTCGSSKN